jgi:hypothetical protein
VTWSLSRGRRSEQPATHLFAERAVAVLGATLVGVALFAHQRWLDRHFLPSFFLTRHSYVLLETLVRIGIAVLGTTLAIFMRRPIGRVIARRPDRALHVVVAAVLAIGASELVLRNAHLRPAEWLGRDKEPRRQADAWLGWTFVPSRSAHSTIGGRVVDYTFDASGYRVRDNREPVDPMKPTILFTGESLMFGRGLRWDESVPAQVGSMTGKQTANMAVDGYATDQAYLRMKGELPRFRQPQAVVAIFMTTLFGRNLDDDRPHLGPGLVWQPATRHTRLRSLVQLVAPYRRTETVERGIALTREVLRATVQLAAARGAMAIIVVPQMGAEDRVEQTLRHRILDEPALPYVLVEIDPGWRVPGDVHPNARAAHAIAAAIAARLTAPPASVRSRLPIPKR